ncbi:SHOCT domain-containing protein [Nocardia sp. CDC159]|uniref:SHOCT domain-containing protein n=1 Tax=Nocardia pulmonis TaxID=2951408 RepID=A0A9X2E2C2_9NOCA|nr:MULTISPECIES: SHOCT domain-containing protein [Nocardia]MCM6772817.1 SHOCT domain-containing protein [Nocardia pulmonis]MCM6785880.1 SHOCT domain-containing protein [Nocardia sp. CDC159]
MNEHLSSAAVSVLADHSDYGWHPGPYFWIFPLLFWLGLITLGIVFRRGRRRDDGIGTLRSAFARGEISEEDFLTRLEVLRRSRRRF